MYLSRIQMDRRDWGVRQCLQDCRDMHRSLMKLFSGSRQEAGVLYRFSPKTMQAYLLSAQKPQPERIPSGMRISNVADTASLENGFCNGACYNFDILGSPCKKVEPANGGNSRRRFLHTPAERLEWLRRKGWQNGFEIQQAQEEVQPALYGSLE